MRFVLFIIFCLLLNAVSSEASDTPNTEENHAILTAKAEALIKVAMKVIKEDEGVVSMSHPGHSFEPKTQILYFRKRGSRIEMIATGVFTQELVDPKTGKKTIITELNRDTIIKYPHDGDYAVSMTDPNLGALDGKDGNEFPAPAEDNEEKDDSRPGYMEYGMGLMFGSLNSTSGDETNVSKITTGYRFPLTHLAYYSDFIPVGVEYDSHKGNFPTKTYQSTIVTSKEAVSTLSFNYRFKPILKRHLAIFAHVNTITDSFSTNNTDASLLTTKMTGLGFGTRVQYELVSPAWKKEKKDFFIQLQSVSAEFNYFPSITATDVGVSRGTASIGSEMMQYRFSATILTWISFIPLFKRWVAQASYGKRLYNLTFSGTTVSEVGNPDTIAEGGKTKESEGDFRFFVGIRIDDPVKFIFGKDEKKDEK